MMIDRKQGYLIEAARNGSGLDFKDFPIDDLPEPIRSYVHSGAVALGCDCSLIALPMLSACAGLIGNRRRLFTKDTWGEPASLWTITVGESGTTKSPAYDLALQPVHEIQGRAFAEHERAMEDYEADLAAWEARDKKARGPKPVPPICGRVTCEDITVEALAVRLKENPNGLLVARDELAGWFRSFDAYRKGAGGDAARWLSFWRGTPLTVDRKSQATIHIHRPCLSITGTIQPGVLGAVLKGEHWEDGMAFRFLLALPPRKPSPWSERVISEPVRRTVRDSFNALLNLECEDDGEPLRVNLSPEAKALWVAFHNAHDAEAQSLTGALASSHAKMEAYAARLALVHHVVRTVSDHRPPENPLEVDPDSMQAGITLARWFGHEARRGFALLGVGDPVEADRKNLLDTVSKHGGRITARELMHSSRRYRDSVGLAEDALNGIAKAGLGEWTFRSTRGRQAREFILFGGGNGNTSENSLGENDFRYRYHGEEGENA